MAASVRIPFPELLSKLTQILLQTGFSPEDAQRCALLFTETTCDGIYTHGVARFPRFMETIRNGSVDVHVKPALVMQSGALERWDGQRGPGILNAQTAMQRAIELGKKHGMGCVALANTNHWMRAGSYGWQAADAGMIGLCWTNTLANLPAWGGSKPVLGNNPLVIAVPRADGHVVLDMAMSQFSYGALAAYRQAGKLLPVEGGFDKDGNLTRDPAAIEASQRPLPIGYWKGAGLSLVLDMVAALLSGGLAAWQIPQDAMRETGLSQVFITINLAALQSGEASAQTTEGILNFLESSGEAATRYPGKKVLETRAENMAKGIPVDEKLWQEICAMLA